MSEKSEYNLPHLDSLIAPEKDTAALAEQLRFSYEQGKIDLGEYEVEKTPREERLIEYAVNAADEYMRELGRNREVHVDPKSIHVLREGGTFELTNGNVATGAHSVILGSIIVDRKENDIEFVSTVFHELIHAKMINSAQLTTNNEIKPYRSGFSVLSRDGKADYFYDLNEGVVGLLERKLFVEKLSKDPSFKEFVETAHIFRPKAEQLEKLVTDVFEKNPEKFKTKLEVYKLFGEAAINGKLLPIARVIESTYGKGSFRALGESTAKYKNKNNADKNR